MPFCHDPQSGGGVIVDGSGRVKVVTQDEMVSVALLPRDNVVEDLLRRNMSAAGDFLAGRKVVDVSHLPGPAQFAVVPDIPGLELEGEGSAASGDDDGGSDSGDSVHYVYDHEVKTYDLQMIFSDVNVNAKLGIPSRVLQRWRRSALTAPVDTAAAAQDYIQAHGYPYYRVRARNYAQSRASARARVNASAKRYVERVPTLGSEIINGMLFIHHESSDNVIEWTVSGPIENATEVYSAFALALYCGLTNPVFAFQLEYEILDISVEDEIRGVVISPAFIGHAAPDGIVPHGHKLPESIAEPMRDSIRAKAGLVRAVRCGDATVGSAVRLNSRYLLVNEHVLMETSSAGDDDDGESLPLTIDGETFAQRTSLSKDLFVVEQPGVGDGWVYRPARIGEKVVLCYSVGGDEVEYTSVGSVINCDPSNLSVLGWPEARSGTSGGAVISVGDGALLGIYSGPAMSASLCSVFTPEHYGKISDLDEVQSASVANTEDTDGVLAKINQRGMTPTVRMAVESMVVLEDAGGVRGVAASVHNRVFTTVDPDVDQLYASFGGSRVPLVFDKLAERLFVALPSAGMPVLKTMTNTRRVELNERVLIVSFDHQGPFVSSSRRVSHVGASGSIFHVKDIGRCEFDFGGGVVIAERDGALLGQFVERVTVPQGSTMRMRCVGIPNLRAGAQSVVQELTEFVARKFPVLNPVTWDPTSVEDVFTHASLRKNDGALMKWALIGDAALKTQWFRSCRDANVAAPEWTTGWQNVQNNANMASVCAEIGMDEIFRRADHTVLPKGSKVFADVLEGFFGLVSEFEPPENFRVVCNATGLLYGGASTPLVSTFPQSVSSFRSRSSSPASVVRAVGGVRTSAAYTSFPHIESLSTSVRVVESPGSATGSNVGAPGF